MTAVVVPSIREKNIYHFINAWREANDEPVTYYIVEDHDTKDFKFDLVNVVHFCWQDIDDDLGEFAHIIPRRTDCIRSYGFLKAAEDSHEIIITLDDDCFPIGIGDQSAIKTHIDTLVDRTSTMYAWETTLAGIKPRGYPYQQLARSVENVINVGLWDAYPDYDAITQLSQMRGELEWELRAGHVPFGSYLPTCGMNLAFKTKMLPAMYFLLMGEHNDVPFDRFGDIWCGVIAKRICDHFRLAIRYGTPFVRHQRASNPFHNLVKEAQGIWANEHVWRVVDSVVLTSNTVSGAYLEILSCLAEHFPDSVYNGYWTRLYEAGKHWVRLVNQRVGIS